VSLPHVRDRDPREGVPVLREARLLSEPEGRAKYRQASCVVGGDTEGGKRGGLVSKASPEDPAGRETCKDGPEAWLICRGLPGRRHGMNKE
jgi:hypothetical protein